MSSRPWEPWMNGQSSLPWATQPIKQSAQQRRLTLWQMYTFFFSRLNFFLFFVFFDKLLSYAFKLCFSYLITSQALFLRLTGKMSFCERQPFRSSDSERWSCPYTRTREQRLHFSRWEGKKIDYSLFTLNAALLRWYELHYIMQIWMQYVVIGLHAFQAWAWLWSWVEWDTSVTWFS